MVTFRDVSMLEQQTFPRKHPPEHWLIWFEFPLSDISPQEMISYTIPYENSSGNELLIVLILGALILSSSSDLCISASQTVLLATRTTCIRIHGVLVKIQTPLQTWNQNENGTGGTQVFVFVKQAFQMILICTWVWELLFLMTTFFILSFCLEPLQQGRDTVSGLRVVLCMVLWYHLC